MLLQKGRLEYARPLGQRSRNNVTASDRGCSFGESLTRPDVCTLDGAGAFDVAARLLDRASVGLDFGEFPGRSEIEPAPGARASVKGDVRRGNASEIKVRQWRFKESTADV